MSNIITAFGRSINTITAEIVALTNQAAQNAWFSMVEIGRRLVEAKSLVDHGEWGAYLKNEVNFSQRTANNFMNIYQEHLKNPNSQAFANLSYTKVVKLLAMPEEDREGFMQEHDVTALSTRQLDQAIKERDDARAAKEAAEAETRDLRQSLLDAQQQAAAAKSSEAAWSAEIDRLKSALAKANAAADKAKKDLATNEQVMSVVKKNAVREAQTDMQNQIESAKKSAVAELQKKLETAQKEAQAAISARLAAEKVAQDAQDKLESSQKVAKLSSPDAAAFNLIFEQLVQDYNKLNGYRKKVELADPELGAKLRAATAKMLDQFRKQVE